MSLFDSQSGQCSHGSGCMYDEDFCTPGAVSLSRIDPPAHACWILESGELLALGRNNTAEGRSISSDNRSRWNDPAILQGRGWPAAVRVNSFNKDDGRERSSIEWYRFGSVEKAEAFVEREGAETGDYCGDAELVSGFYRTVFVPDPQAEGNYVQAT